MLKSLTKLSSVLVAATVFVSTVPRAGESAELNVLVPNNLRLGMSLAIKKFETDSGHRITAAFAGSRQLVKRFQGGEKVDVVILRTSQLSKFKKAGKLASTTTPTVARVGIGAAVKRGSAKPDISSIAKLKSALRAAKSVGHSDPKVGFLGKHLDKSFAKLELTGALKGKRRTFPPGQGLWNAIAAGEVELGLGPISAIYERKDLDFVGPVPSEIQSYNEFAAGIAKTTANPEAATAFLSFLASPSGQAILRSSGL